MANERKPTRDAIRIVVAAHVAFEEVSLRRLADRRADI